MFKYKILNKGAEFLALVPVQVSTSQLTLAIFLFLFKTYFKAPLLLGSEKNPGFIE